MMSSMGNMQHDHQQDSPSNPSYQQLPPCLLRQTLVACSASHLTGAVALRCRSRLRPRSPRCPRGVLRLRRLRPGAPAAAGHLRHAAGLLSGLPGMRIPSATVPVVLQAAIHIHPHTCMPDVHLPFASSTPIKWPLQAPVNVPVPYAAPGAPPSYASVPLPAPYAKPPYYYSSPQAVLPLPTYPPSYNPATAVTSYQVDC